MTAGHMRDPDFGIPYAGIQSWYPILVSNPAIQSCYPILLSNPANQPRTRVWFPNLGSWIIFGFPYSPSDLAYLTCYPILVSNFVPHGGCFGAQIYDGLFLWNTIK